MESESGSDLSVPATRGLKYDMLVPYTRFFEGRLRDDKVSRPPVGGPVRNHTRTERDSHKRQPNRKIQSDIKRQSYRKKKTRQLT